MWWRTDLSSAPNKDRDRDNNYQHDDHNSDRSRKWKTVCRCHCYDGACFRHHPLYPTKPLHSPVDVVPT